MKTLTIFFIPVFFINYSCFGKDVFKYRVSYPDKLKIESCIKKLYQTRSFKPIYNSIKEILNKHDSEIKIMCNEDINNKKHALNKKEGASYLYGNVKNNKDAGGIILRCSKIDDKNHITKGCLSLAHELVHVYDFLNKRISYSDGVNEEKYKEQLISELNARRLSCSIAKEIYLFYSVSPEKSSPLFNELLHQMINVQNLTTNSFIRSYIYAYSKGVDILDTKYSFTKVMGVLEKRLKTSKDKMDKDILDAYKNKNCLPRLSSGKVIWKF